MLAVAAAGAGAARARYRRTRVFSYQLTHLPYAIESAIMRSDRGSCLGTKLLRLSTVCLYILGTYMIQRKYLMVMIAQ